MDLGKVFFCSISNTKSKLILQSYTNNNGNGNGDGNVNVNVNVNDSSSSSTLESLAHLCLEHTPPFHAHYSHTANSRTFAFLIGSDLTFFAITAADHGRPVALLHRIRDRFNGAAAQQQHFDLGDIIARDGGSAAGAEEQGSGPSSASSSTKAPLLDRREVGVEVVDVECSPASAAASPTAAQLQMKKRRAKVWWRHVKVVMVVDLFLCFILFAIWMAVCRGFHCLS